MSIVLQNELSEVVVELAVGVEGEEVHALLPCYIQILQLIV